MNPVDECVQWVYPIVIGVPICATHEIQITRFVLSTFKVVKTCRDGLLSQFTVRLFVLPLINIICQIRALVGGPKLDSLFALLPVREKLVYPAQSNWNNSDKPN